MTLRHLRHFSVGSRQTFCRATLFSASLIIFYFSPHADLVFVPTHCCVLSLSPRVCVSVVKKSRWPLSGSGFGSRFKQPFIFSFFPRSKIPPAAIWHVRGRRCFSHKNKVVKCTAGHLRFNTALMLSLPLLPAGEDRKKKKKNGRCLYFSGHSFIHSFDFCTRCSCTQGQGRGMGANPSCHGAKAAFHPGHGASLSQGHTERQTLALVHTEGQFRVPSLPPSPTERLQAWWVGPVASFLC